MIGIYIFYFSTDLKKIFKDHGLLRITAISRPPTTAGTQATPGMKATTVKQATAATPP
jgi:hypothetical protein